MKNIIYLFILFAISLSIKSYSQDVISLNYRIEKQSMSTPMSDLEEVFFNNPYYSRPINIKFNGQQLHMYYDNGASFINKEVSEVKSNANFYDNKEITIRHFYTFNDNTSDTLMLVIDREVSYIQFVLPTRNQSGEKIGYTSYKKYVGKEELALK